MEFTRATSENNILSNIGLGMHPEDYTREQFKKEFVGYLSIELEKQDVKSTLMNDLQNMYIPEELEFEVRDMLNISNFSELHDTEWYDEIRDYIAISGMDTAQEWTMKVLEDTKAGKKDSEWYDEDILDYDDEELFEYAQSYFEICFNDERALVRLMEDFFNSTEWEEIQKVIKLKYAA